VSDAYTRGRTGPEQEKEVNGQGHPLDQDLARYVDEGIAPESLAEHVNECPGCRRRVVALRATPAPPALDQRRLLELLALASQEVAPKALVQAHDREPPDPALGQVWRLVWGTDVALGLIVNAGERQVTVWPASLDADLADATGVVIDADHTALGASLACWPGLATVIGSFVLHTCLAALPDLEPVAILDGWRADAPRPAGLPQGTAWDVTDPRNAHKAELADLMAALAAVNWEDPAWSASGELKPRSLAEVLREHDKSATWLKEALGLADRDAVAVYRGTRPLAPAEHERLEAELGHPVAPSPAPDERVLVALDRPSLRPLLRQVAAAEHVEEGRLRREVAITALRAAARQVDRGERDVLAQLRVELARRLAAATGAPRL
jgi:hypothetical protein